MLLAQLSAIRALALQQPVVHFRFEKYAYLEFTAQQIMSQPCLKCCANELKCVISYLVYQERSIL